MGHESKTAIGTLEAKLIFTFYSDGTSNLKVEEIIKHEVVVDKPQEPREPTT